MATPGRESPNQVIKTQGGKKGYNREREIHCIFVKQHQVSFCNQKKNKCHNLAPLKPADRARPRQAGQTCPSHCHCPRPSKTWRLRPGRVHNSPLRVLGTEAAHTGGWSDKPGPQAGYTDSKAVPWTACASRSLA